MLGGLFRDCCSNRGKKGEAEACGETNTVDNYEMSCLNSVVELRVCVYLSTFACADNVV